MTLLQRIDRYLKRTGVRPTNFGRAAARDPCLVIDLKRGRQLRPTLARRIHAYLDEQEK